MKNVALNDNMNLMIPEGFAEITAAEAEKMVVCNGPAPMWNIYSKEEDTLITASWIKGGFITSHLYSAGDMAKSLLNSCRSGLKVESPYACTYSEISETALNGHKAYTYSCSFRAFSNGEMTDMIRETVVAKINNVFYVFQSVSRNAEGAKVADFFYAVDDAFQFAAAA